MELSQEAGEGPRAYLALLGRRKWVVLAITLAVTGAALAVSYAQTPVYQATARLLVQRSRSLADTGPPVGVDPSFVQEQVQVITSPPVQDGARDRLGTAPRVSVSVIPGTPAISVTAQSTRPRQAAAIANAYIDSYKAYQKRQSTDDLAASTAEVQHKVDGLQTQIDNLGGQLAGFPACSGGNLPPECSRRESLQKDRDALVSQQGPLKAKLDQLQLDSSLGTNTSELVTPATVPTVPIRPTPKKTGLLGLAVGLVFGVAVAFLLEYLDESIKGKEELERATGGLPVLGIIPAVTTWKITEDAWTISQAEPQSPAAESYRSLRTAIKFLGVNRNLQVILITSANAAEGKTTTIANLGVALVRAGERVAMVSCDLRRPRLHQFFNLSNDIGFTSVLLGEAPLSAALQPVPKHDGLWLLASGPVPPNPSELLASGGTAQILTGLRQQNLTVLIDCPPVLPVTDAAVLSPTVDACLLVVRAGSTTTKPVARAAEMLQQVGAPLLGTVLNNAAPQNGYGYHYTYGENLTTAPSNGAKGETPKQSQPAG